MTLYLKYRPQAFADVVGQDHVVTTLEQAVKQDRTSHAYLFCGTRGTGKTSVARILAKTILLQGITDEVLTQHILKGIDDGSLVDLTEIDAASNRRIDDIRDLIEKVGYAPAVAKAKVYIIDEVHMLTKEAFNALLKTLEEPPEYAYFILATTELHKVPDTIQSRCQRFLFKKVREDDIISRLQYIVDQEHLSVDREVLRAIAHYANGSFRDGIALLDQLQSIPKITLLDVTERVGKTSTMFIDSLLEALETNNVSRITEIIASMEEANIPLESVATDILTSMRQNMHAVLEAKMSPASFIQKIDILLQALRDLRLSPIPGLTLESALIMLCSLSDEPQAPQSTIKKQPVTPRQEAPIPSPVSPAPVPEKKPSIIEAEDISVQSILRHWEELLGKVTPASVRMSLKDASVSLNTDGSIKLSFASAFHRDKVANVTASRTVEDALHSIFMKPIRIQCSLEATAQDSKISPETDLVDAAAEVFGSM